MKVDLNADMGESYGPWTMGDDAALLNIISSANIACGAHAGDPDVMAKTMANAQANGVSIGAHPGFDDLRGFGRYDIRMPLPSLQNSIRYQIGAAQAMAHVAGAKVRHVKLHGAMANMASVDHEMALACYEAVKSVAPTAILVVIAATAQQKAAEELGMAYACEIFADRAYNDDATLVHRSQPGAVIHDPAEAATRMVDMVAHQAIRTAKGTWIETPIDTICCHGDTPAAVEIAAQVRRALENADHEIAAFSGRR